MSDEYLFEKQGSDGEIEKLENMLSVYRIEPAAPKLPTAADEKKLNGRFSWFKLGYAFAFATVVIVLFATVTMFQYLGRSNGAVASISPVETSASEHPFITPTISDPVTVDGPTASSEKTVNSKKVVRPVPIVVHHSRKPAPNNLVATVPRLTKEEQYAYDQLKVALWLTGSKLKVVQDTIDRVDDQKTQTANEKR